MEEQNIKPKSFLEKLVPIILIIVVIAAGYFAYTKFAPSLGGTVNTINVSTASQTLTQVDIEFLKSEAFTSLKFIPESSAFDKVQGEILKGRADPFAPVY
jgi:hypothetical protein